MLIVIADGGPETIARDLAWFRELLSDEDLRPVRYLPETRLQRPMESWLHGRPVEELIRLGCNRSLLIWFSEQTRGRTHMDGADEEYILERGTLWQEVYVCLLRFESLDDHEVRRERGLYWARALYCLFLLCDAGCPNAPNYFSAVLNTSVLSIDNMGVNGLFNVLERRMYASVVTDSRRQQEMGILAREVPRDDN
eukprot:GHVU01165564.1.p1 GENE.GHVU01165564.1~~GHVU01165564.1.p1  ORF type:complete len:196 (+),score=4.58 GHVU01165564.1:692-1279(+)